ncbi:transposase [soil metagenome]
MEKYKNKYRTASARAQWWDYGADAAYFITICCKKRKHYFGNISDNKMHLSPAGILADVFWHEIKNHAKNVELDAFQVMPNHLHGILILDGNNIVETRHALPLQIQPTPTIGQLRFQNQGSNTVSSIIGSYKSAVTKHANRLGLDFNWQYRFHDHIIRDDAEFLRIAHYIENNVETWGEDKFFNPE